MYCHICGDQEAHFESRLGYAICRYCLKEVPKGVKLSFDEFKEIYFSGENVNGSIAHGFYEDYLYSTIIDIKRYIKETTMEVEE